MLLSSQLLWPTSVCPDQRMYPPFRKDFISLTLSDPHSHTYNNGKHRRQSCWRVSGPEVQYTQIHTTLTQILSVWYKMTSMWSAHFGQTHSRLLWQVFVLPRLRFASVSPYTSLPFCSELRCAQTERNERRKITYRVKVKTQLHVMSLRETRISWYTWRKSLDVASIAPIPFIASSLQVNIIELFGRQPISIEILTGSMTSRQHECCWNLLKGHGIRHNGQNNCCCVWILSSSDTSTLYSTGWSCEHRHSVVEFSNISGTSAPLPPDATS